MPNDRSTERLLQRKEIAEEAGKAHPGEWGTDIRYNLKMTAVRAGNGEPLCMMTDDEDVATATHIAISDPGTTQKDIEEIIKLRAENERLNKEADWLAKTLGVRVKDSFGCAWCWLSESDMCNGNCTKSLRNSARKAVEEEENV